jgi:hypothetical protein
MFYSKQTLCTNMQKQTSTTKNNTPYKEGIKRDKVSVLETQTQTIVEKVHLSRYLYYNTQRLYARYILIQ